MSDGDIIKGIAAIDEEWAEELEVNGQIVIPNDDGTETWFDPLINWNHTMMVLEKTKPRPFLFEYNDQKDEYVMEFGNLEPTLEHGRCYPHPNPCMATDKDPQKAILLAALKL